MIDNECINYSFIDIDIAHQVCKVLKIEFWYTDTHTIKLTPASVTLTPASQIRKEFFVEQKSLHHWCTRNALEVLQHKALYTYWAD
jgi:hypothetical protein